MTVRLPLKILILSHRFYPHIGGIEAISEMLANEFTKAGHQVKLLTWSSDEEEKKSFPYLVIRTPNIRRLISEHKWADIVFENNPSLRLSWPGLIFNRPFVIGLQTWISRADGSTGLHELLKIQWLKRAQKVISCSEAIRRICFPSSIVIGNPYQEEVFRILPDVRKTVEFVFLGRLVSDKGADIAIRAFHKVITMEGTPYSSNASLTIVGSGPEELRLERLVAELKMEKNISFRGALRGEELVECLNMHNYLLVPSVWQEPFGIVALEGMACGCLPIVSDGGGLPDAVGKAGLVFKRGDIDSLVLLMLKVLQDRKLEESIRSEAPFHLASHTAKKVSKLYLDEIEEAYNKKIKNSSYFQKYN